MANLNQIAIAFADSMGKGLDVAYVERVKFSIKYYRAKYIRQQAERSKLNPSIVQSYVDELISVDEADTCVVVAGCNTKRTRNQVPRPISIKGFAPFFYVGPVLISDPNDIPFAFTNTAGIANARYSRFTGNLTRYMYRNNYIYTNDCLRKYIRISHPFENPEEVIEKCTTAISCYTDDNAYPIEIHMLDFIYKELANAELRLRPEEEEELIEKA